MSINKLILLIVSLLAFSSCASEYQINGSSSVSRLDGKMLFVKVPQGDKMINVDSAEVVHGLFSMNGPVDSTFIASLYMDDQSIMPFVVERGNIEILIDNAIIKVTGTPLNDCLYEFVGKKNSLDDRAYEVERMESRMIMDGKSSEEIEVEMTKEREKISEEMNKLAKEFIQANYENVLGPGVFLMLCNSFPYPVLTPVVEEIVNEAPASFQNHPMIKEYMKVARENMEKLKKME
ncbi:MAG: DUF4369 domain-containing protein [Bacteroides sp.]|nr:DUF4369 domain-containing protein [Bacteroides sp.]